MEYGFQGEEALSAKREKWLSQQGGRSGSLCKEGKVALSARREKWLFQQVENYLLESPSKKKWHSQSEEVALSAKKGMALSTGKVTL